MNFELEELMGLADILGKGDPHIKKCLEKALRNPKSAKEYKQHFLRLLRKQGISLCDLPVFSQGPEDSGEEAFAFSESSERAHRIEGEELSAGEKPDIEAHPSAKTSASPGAEQGGQAVGSGERRAHSEEKIHIGSIVYANRAEKPLFIPLASFAEHMLIAGHSGAGKSFFLRYLIEQFAEKQVAVWVFDREKEYRSLLKKDIGQIAVVRPDQDRFNFFEPPPSVQPEEWIARIKNVFREVFFLLDGSINLLDHLIRNLYKNKGVFEGSQSYPSLSDLIRLLEAVEFKPGTRFYGFRESLLNRLLGLQGELGKALACAKGFDIRSLTKGVWIFECSGLSDDKANFYIAEKFLRAFAYFETLPPKALRLIIAVDEAHALFNEKTAKRYDLGEGMLFTSARTARKRGIGLIYSDQTPSLLPPTIASNVDKIAVMRLVNARDIRAVASALSLTPQQAEKLHTLPKAHMVFQSSHVPDPALVRVPSLSFEFVSQEEVDARMLSVFAGLSYEPLQGESGESGGEKAGEKIEKPLPGEKKARMKKAGEVRLWSEIAKITAELGWVPVSSIAEQLASVPPWSLRRALAEMSRSGLIELCPISLGGRGNPRTYAVLKQKGAEFIGSDWESVRLRGRGSAEHVILQNMLAEAMRNNGLCVEIEYSLNGKSADIAEIRKEGITAYEIELSPSHAHVAENALRDLEAGFDEVVIIAKNQAGMGEAKACVYKEVPWEKLQRIHFKLIRDFL